MIYVWAWLLALMWAMGVALLGLFVVTICVGVFRRLMLTTMLAAVMLGSLAGCSAHTSAQTCEKVTTNLNQTCDALQKVCNTVMGFPCSFVPSPGPTPTVVSP